MHRNHITWRKTGWIYYWLALVFLGFALGKTFAQAPANDNFTNAFTLTGPTANITNSTVGATAQANEPKHAGISAGHSIWYNWTAPADGSTLIDLAGSLAGTRLAVYLGSNLTSLSLVASNANANLDGTGRSVFRVSSGLRYNIAVDATNTGPVKLNLLFATSCFPPQITQQPQDQFLVQGATATFKVTATSECPLTYQWVFNNTNLVANWTNATLSLTNISTSVTGRFNVIVAGSGGAVTSSTASLVIIVRPSNDSFSKRFTLPGSNITTNGSNLNATSETGEPAPAGWPTPQSVWYTWTAPTNGLASVALTNYGGVNQVLAVYTGDTLPQLVSITNDSWSTPPMALQFYATRGTRYQMTVAKVTTSGTGGPFQLSLNFLATNFPPVITLVPTNQAAFKGGAASFRVGLVGALPVTYQWLFNGDILPGATNSVLSLTNIAGGQEGQYSVTISTAGGTTNLGAFLDVIIPPPNDNFASSLPLVGLTLTASGDNRYATSETGEPKHGGGSTPGASVWYTWMPNAAGDVTLDVSDYVANEALAVYTGNFLTNLALIVSNSSAVSPVTVHFAATNPAAVYRIAVSDRALTGSAFQLHTKLLTSNYPPTVVQQSPPVTNVLVKGNLTLGWVLQSDFAVTGKWLFNDVPVTGGRLVLSGKDSSGMGIWTGTFSMTNLSASLIGTNTLTAIWTSAGGSVTNIHLVNVTSPPANDNFANRITLTGSNVTTFGTTLMASLENGEPGYPGILSGGSVWWTWLAPTSGTVYLTLTGTNISSQALAVFTGNAFSNLATVLRAGPGPTSLSSSFLTTPGTTNQIAIAGGAASFNLDLLFLDTSKPPVLVQQPTDVTVPSGGSANFSVQALGGGLLSYQWQHAGVSLPGATNAFLTMNNLSAADAGVYNVIVSSPGGSTKSANAVLTVLLQPQITQQPVDRLVVEGATTDFQVSAAGTPPLNYQWQFYSTNLVGATNASLVLTSVRTNQSGPYRVLISNSGGTTSSVSVTLTVKPYLLPSISLTTPTNGALFLLGSSVGIAAAFSDLTGIVTQVQFLEGATNVIGRVSSAPYSLTWYGMAEGQYRLTALALDNLGLSATSSVVNIRVGTSPSITLQPTGAVASVSSNVSFQVAASGTGPLQYQWYFNQTNVLTDEVGASLTVSNVQPADAGLYSVSVSNAFGGVVSTSAALVVLSPLNILSQPANQVAAVGSSVTFQVLAAGSGTLNYQWFFNRTNPIAGALSNALILSNVQLTNAGEYSVSVSNALGGVLSLPATLTVLAPPSISKQPTRQVVAVGSTATFRVTAAGSAPLAFQWYFNRTNLLPGAVSDTLILVDVHPGEAGEYSVAISNAVGGITSSVVTLTVLAPPTLVSQPTNQIVAAGGTTVFQVVATGSRPLSYQWYFNLTNPIPGAITDTLNLSGLQPFNSGEYSVVVSNVLDEVTSAPATLTVLIPPSIVTQPTNSVLPVGSNATFQSLASGSGPLTYHWYFNRTNPVPGANQATLVVTNVQLANTGEYSLSVSNAVGSVVSSTAFLTVLVPPAIVSQPTNEVLAVGSSAIFRVTATGSSPLAFQWYYNRTNPISGAVSETLSIANVQLDNSGEYSLAVSNAVGGVVSSVAVLRVLIPPSIGLQPTNQVVAVGSAASFRITAAGSGPLSYQWYYNRSNAIAGAVSDTLVLSSVQPANSGEYSVVVSNAVGQASSSFAKLAVLGPPSILSQPASIVAAFGGTGTFQVVAAGSEPLSFRWFYNQTNVLNVDNAPVLTLTNLQLTDAGTYSVVVSNAVGTIASSLAQLSVLIPPGITRQPIDVQTNQAADVLFSVFASGSGPLNYQWWFNSTNPIPFATNANLVLTAVQLNQAGTYSVTVSNAVGNVTSANARLTVIPQIGPLFVTLDSPSDGASFGLGTAISVNASASEVNGTIQRTMLFNQAQDSTVSLLSSVNSSVQSFLWTNAPLGTNRLFAVATDLANTTATSAVVRVIVTNTLPGNTPPSFTKGADITIVKNSGRQDIVGWATAIRAGPPSENSQKLNFTLNADDPSLFALQPSLSVDGTLSFAPAPNVEGTAHLTAVLHDDGGTANGGRDSSDPQSFTITIVGPRDVAIVVASSGVDLTAITNDVHEVSMPGEQALTFTVLNRADLKLAMVSLHRCVLWYDPVGTPVSTNDIQLLQNAYSNGIPLMFVGPQVDSAASSLGTEWQTAWQQLVHLHPNRSTISHGTVFPLVSHAGALPDGPYGDVQTFQIQGPVGWALVSGNADVLCEITDQTFTSDVFVSYPSVDDPNQDQVRTCTILLPLTGAGDNNSFPMRKSMFQNALCWTLQCGACSAVYLTFDYSLAPQLPQTGVPMTLNLSLGNNGECAGVAFNTGIQVSESFRVLSASSDFGSISVSNNLVSLQVGRIAERQQLNISLSLTPLVPGWVTNAVHIQAASTPARDEVIAFEIQGQRIPEMSIQAAADSVLLTLVANPGTSYTLERAVIPGPGLGLTWETATNFVFSPPFVQVQDKVQRERSGMLYRLRRVP